MAGAKNQPKIFEIWTIKTPLAAKGFQFLCALRDSAREFL